MTVMPCRVQHRHHFYNLAGFIHFVDHTVGKTFRITPADILGGMATAVEQRVVRKSVPNPNNFFDKFCPESGLAGFIPMCRFGDVQLDCGRKLYPPVHLLNRDRSRAFISLSDIAAAGASRIAINRDSTKASSASLNGGSSSSNARRMSSCRCSKVSAGSSWRTSVKLITEFTRHARSCQGEISFIVLHLWR